LKIYLFPSIMQEIDQVTETYINYTNEINRTNSEKTLLEFEHLRESISRRIVELENFYENNIFDSRISNFEKARAKLKKLLRHETEAKNDQENNPNLTFQKLNSERSKGANNAVNNLPKANNQRSLETKKLSIEKIPVRKAFGANSNNAKKRTASTDNKDKLHASKNNGKERLNSSLASLKDVKKENNNLDFTAANNNNRSNISFDSNQGKKPKTEKNLKPQAGQDNGQGGLFNNLLGDGYLEFKDLAKWKEIVFKIKLTEAEYKLLIKEKANLVNLK